MGFRKIWLPRMSDMLGMKIVNSLLLYEPALQEQLLDLRRT